MIRLGVLPYLNAQPLTWALRAQEEVQLVEAVPSALCLRLAAGEVEAALVPVVECLRAGWSILPGLCIGGEGPVGSVLLFRRTPWDQVRQVALDASSRTCAALARVLLAEWGVACTYRERPPDLAAMLGEAEAALLIGDPALQEAQRQAAAARPLPVVDLGEAWTALTGLPLVFAVWAAPAGYDWGPLAPRLRQAYRQGMVRLEEMAGKAAARLGLPVEVCRDYLARRIRYRMSEHHLAGLREFGRRCQQLGLVAADGEPRLWSG